jgi:hypothetical protein
MTVRWFGVRPLVGIELGFQTPSSPQGEHPSSCECCDLCGRRVPTDYIYFDGRAFLCLKCAQKRENLAAILAFR